MRTKLLALLLGTLPVILSAQTLVVTRSGYYLLNVDAVGRPSLTQFQQVVNLGGPTDPPPPPPPPPVSNLREKAKSLALATGDHTGILALSSLYGIVADRVERGEIAPERTFAATVQLTDAVLANLGTTAKWVAWRSAISDELIMLQQTGKLTTKAQFAAAMRDLAGGLEEASKSTGILDKINWEKLFELIKLILTLLAMFK